MKILVILCNWKTADRVKTGFLLNDRPKRAENTPSDTTHSTTTVS